MSDVLQLKQERQELFEDLYNLRKPKRVPISMKVNTEFAVQYAGLNMVSAQMDPTIIETGAEKVCSDFFADKSFFGSARRSILFYNTLDSNYFSMGSSGFLQHPEITLMDEDEYSELIDNPYDFLIEKILPRMYPGLSRNSLEAMYLFTSGQNIKNDEAATLSAISKKMDVKYGYFNNPGKGNLEVPIDWIGRILRGFKGVIQDMKRRPAELLEACEALHPLLHSRAISREKNIMSDSYLTAHMAGFIGLKEFEKFYWPGMTKNVNETMETGHGVSFFLEHDWMRYVDHLAELHKGIRMRFEYGDMQLTKDKLGKNHILSGFYPTTLFKTGTKQQNIDKAKEYLDILGPGGNCTFDVDKTLTTYEGGGENIKAVLEYIRDNGKY